MITTTIGNLLIDQALPPALRRPGRKLDKKGVAELFDELAKNHPEEYKATAKRLADVARNVAYQTGGFSFGLNHLRTPRAALEARQQIRREVNAVHSRTDLDDAAKDKAVVEILQRHQKPLEEAIFNESLSEGNPLVNQVMNVGRGNKTSLKSLRGGDLLYEDHTGTPIPVPILSSYSEGLRPVEYFAASFGARKGVVDTKRSTQDAGALGKQLGQATHRLVVTAHDADREPMEIRGLPVETADPDNAGQFLAKTTGTFGRNTLLTPFVLKTLREQGHDHILVRSPTVGGPPQGGVYSMDLGIRERGGPSPRGDFVGAAAAQAIAEKLSQGQLSSKHGGGVAGASKAVSGFKLIDCLAGDTLVRMADWSCRTVAELEPGDMILGADFVGETFPVRVNAVACVGLRRCFQSVFRIGKSDATIELQSTLEHKVLMARRGFRNGKTGWQFPRPIPIGERTSYPQVAKLAGRFISDDHLRNEKFALLVGLILGDGCYTECVQGVKLACCDPSLINDIRHYLRTLGLKAVRSGKCYYRISQIKQTWKPGKPRAREHPVKAWLRARGMYGKYTHEKELPPDVNEWSNASIAKLIAGLIATDGCVYETCTRSAGFNFVSTSRSMVAGVRELLALRFGIYGGALRMTPPERHTKAKLPLWRFDITELTAVAKFASIVTIPGIKGRLLKQLLLRQERKHPTRPPGRATLQQQIDLGMQPMWDIEVDHDDHLFVLANGLVVSNSLVQASKNLRGAATHAQRDGRVTNIADAPQGGKNVTVNGHDHYVPEDQELRVKPGDLVEAGDPLSDGIPRPDELVKHKGIGEGRRQFIKIFGDAYRGAGMSAHRKNIELLARGLIDHVEMQDEWGHYLPDDIVPYSAIESAWEPRPGTRRTTPQAAIGKYLESPVLHHTVGTQIRPSMLQDLNHFGVKDVLVHDEPPPFKPVMIRGMSNLLYDPDWMTRHLGSNLEKGLLEATHRGRISDSAGTSFVPAAIDRPTFGRHGLTKAWDPKDRDHDGKINDGTPQEGPAGGYG